MTNEVASIGVAIETDAIERGIKSLDVLAQQGPKVEKSMAGVESAAVRTGKSLKSLAEGSSKGLDEIGKAAPAAAKNIGTVASSADDAKKSLAAMASSASGISQVNAAAAQMATSFGNVSSAARANVSTMQGVEAAVNSLNESERKYIQSLVEEARMVGMGKGDRAAYIAQSRGMSTAAQDLARAVGNKAEEMEKAGKSTSLMTKAGEELLSVAKPLTGIFAAWKLSDFIQDSTMLAARFETMGVVMGVAGNNAGYTRKEMDAFAESLQKSGISMMQSRNAMTQLATAHIDLAKASALGRAAQDLAVVGGINSSEALGRMINGIKAGEVEILRTLGLNVNFEASYRKLASTLNISTDSLTENQKAMARTNAVLESSIAYAGIYEESMTTAGKAITSLSRYWEDLKVKSGNAFLPALAESVNDLTAALKAANTELEKSGAQIDDVGSTLAGGVKVAFQTIAVLGANVAFVLKTMAGEVKTLATQAVALAHFDFEGAAGIGQEWTNEAKSSRAALDAFEAKMLGVTDATKQQAMAANDSAAAYEKQAGAAKKMDEQQRIAAANSAQLLSAARDSAMKLMEAARSGQTVEEKRLEIVKQLRTEYERTQAAAAGLSQAERVKATQDYAVALRAANAANQPGVDRNSLLDAIAHVESGGRQFDGRGNVIKSGAGALGMYQIMPGSGPDMARMAGVEWSQARLEQDASYGRTLASAYIDYLMRIFDNDAVKALTAYHSGQGTVGKAIAQAGVNGDWKQFLGPQGQQYANSVLGQFTQDAKGNYTGLRPGVSINKDAIAEQQKLREMMDSTTAATAAMKAQQEGYNKVMADFIGMKATKAWEAMTPEMQKAQQQQAIARSNTDALTQSHQVLEAALKGASAGWEDYAAATSGAANFTKEMASEQARYDQVVQESIKNGLTETSLMRLKEGHLKSMAALQEKDAITNAAALARQALQMEEANKLYGKSAIAIGEMSEQRWKDALAAEMQANGYSELAKSLEAELKWQSRVNVAMRQSEMNKVTDAFKERIRSAKELEKLATAELQLIGLSGIERTKVIAQLEAQLQVQRDIAELERKGLTGADLAAASEKAREAADAERLAKIQRAYVSEWEKSFDQTSQALTDALMRGGKDAGEYLKDYFRTLVLRPIIQAIVNPVAAPITSAVQSLLGQGPGGGGFMSGGFADWSTWGNSSSDWLMTQSTKLGLNGMQSMGDAAFALGDTIKGVDTYLKGIPGMSGGIGSAAGYLGAIFALTQGKVGTGIGSAIGTLALPGIGTMIGGMLGGLLDGLDDSGTPHLGAAARYRNGSSEQYREGMPADAWVDQTYTTVSTITTALGKALDNTAKAFGQKAGYEIISAFSDDSSKDGAFGALHIVGPDGKKLVDWSSFDPSWGGRWFADGQEGATQWANATAMEVKGVLEKMDIPAWSRQLLDAAKDLDSLNAALQQIGTVKAVFDQLGASMQIFAGISGDLQTQLLATAGSMDALVSNANAFNEGFYSEAERMARLNDQVTRAIQGMGFEINPFIEGSKEAFKQLVEAAMGSGQGELAAKLMALSGAFANAADYAAKAADEAQKAAKAAADEAQKRARDAAIANFEAAVGREQEYWQKIVSDSQAAAQAISSILNPLKQSAKELFGSIDAAQQMQAAQGMVYIEQALAGMRGGAKLTDYGGLTDAITAARGGITSGRYASQFERDRDALVLANQLSQIAGYGDEQLSFEERQVKASQEQLERLDKTLAYWRDLLDDNKAQIDATLTVTDAIKPLYALIPDSKKPGTTTPATPSGGAVWGGSSGGGSASSYVKLDLDAGTRTYADGSVQKLTPDEIYWLRLQMGWQNLPSYDVGTNYVQRDQIAKIHAGEAIIPKAFNPWAGGAMSGGNNNARLEALVAQLIDENRTQAGQIVRLQGVVAKLLQRWDGDGMPPVREEAIA